MAFKMNGFNPGEGTGINMGMLPEVKVTDKYPSKKAKRKGEERKLKQKLHSNPVVKNVHGTTDKAADVIKKIGSTAVQLYTGSAILSGGRKLIKARKLAKNKFNLSKIKESVLDKLKKSTKVVAPIIADDVIVGVSTKKKDE
tara:strand:+ start:1145 stop:1570 length:426 start_codon:yes stop_codon:yes gene_type:complete